MRLARIRRRSGAPIELVAAAGDGLVPLHDVTGCESADPVAALATLGVPGLQVEVERLLGGRAALLAAGEVVFEPPVASCSKICCFALNYTAHAEESRLEV